MKTNKKLSLNKQIVSNLDDIKGGEDGNVTGLICVAVTELICPIVKSRLFDEKKYCLTDGCHTKEQNCTQAFGGSCAKCQ